MSIASLLEPIANLALLPLMALLSLFIGWAASGRGRDLPPLGLPERVIAYVLLGIVAVSWLGVLLAVLDLFVWPLFVGLVIALCVWRLWRSRNTPISETISAKDVRRTPLGASIALALLLVGAGWLYARPSESYLLVDDSSVYTLGGIVLAREGALVHRDAQIYEYEATLPGDYWTEAEATPSMAAFSDFAYQFYPSEAIAAVLTRHYGPFFPTSLVGGTVEIGFLPLPKVWVALVVWLFGPGYAVWPVCFFGVVGLAALYALGSRILDWRVGLGAASLMGIGAVQVWFARLPISEIYAQAMLLAGLFLVTLVEDAGESPRARCCARWAGLAFGALAVLRLEALPVLVVLMGFLVLSWGRRAWEDAARRELLLVTTISGVIGMAISVLRAPFYWFTRGLTVLSPNMARLAIAGLLAALVAGALLWPLLRRRRQWLPKVLASIETWGVAVAPALLLGWSLVAVWHLVRRDLSSSLAGWLVQYWTWPGLVLGVAGALALCLRRRPQAGALHALLGSSGAFMLLFSFTTLVSPLHPWAMRRLVPLILPALAVGTTAALLYLPQHLFRARYSGGAAWKHGVLWGVALAAILALGYAHWQRTQPILFHRDREGLWEQLVALHEQLPEGAVLLFDDSNEGRAMPQVMDLVFGRPSYVLNASEVIRADSPVVDRLIRSAKRQGREVFFMNLNPMTHWWPEAWELEHEGSHAFAMPILEQVRGRPPLTSDIIEHRFSAQLYRLARRDVDSAIAAFPDGLEVPLGPEGYPYLRRGFFPAEQDGDGAVYRWTDGDALVVVPWPSGDSDEPVDLCLRLDLGTWRPAGEAAPRLQITVENVVVYHRVLGATEHESVELTLDTVRNTGIDDLEIRLLSNTWSAARFSQGQDQRELGVILRDIEVRPLEWCDQP